MSKNIVALIGLITIALLTVNAVGQTDCSQTTNSYWTGYRCACKVGYKNVSSACVPLTLQKYPEWVIRQPTINGMNCTYTPPANTTNTTNTTNNQNIVNTQCYLPFQYYDGVQCVCLTGYNRMNGLCVSNGGSNSNNTNNTNNTNGTVITCQDNAKLVSGVCVCNSGYTNANNICVPTVGGDCGANSYNNGLGFCVCNTGYYKDSNGVCQLGTPCPPSSTRKADGTCVCNEGLTMYSGYCAKCPQGATFDANTQKCIYVCGQNAAYNETAKVCLCLNGYGIDGTGTCQQCSANFFVLNNYCVTCPINSNFNSTTKNCQCNTGFLANTAGFCVKKCANNEVFNSASQSCVCFTGLGRTNGVCGVCAVGTIPDSNGNCAGCSTNQVLYNGQCICANGYIANQYGVCTVCSQVTGAFLVGSQCATCPGNLIYDGTQCGCPSTQIKVGTNCVNPCNNDQLIDNTGACYTCPVYELISNGECVCAPNYIRNNSTGRCQLKCAPTQFVYQGRCAQCPLNLVYRPQIKGCACPNGQYLSINGVCQVIVLQPINCTAGFYFDNTQGCLACPSGCKTCSSASVCTSCSTNGFIVQNNVCTAYCGDGIIVASQSCDDKNQVSGDGCSNTCKIQAFYVCSGQPSVCTYNGPVVCGDGRIGRGEVCDDGNTKQGDGCSNTCQVQTGFTCTGEPSACVGSNNNNSNQNGNVTHGLALVGSPNTNINNVFITLKTNPTFTFANQNDMQNFMKTNFPNSTVPSVYCSQRASPDLNLFDCLCIYSSGVPNQQFNIQFSYNYQGQTGFLSVPVNPLATQFATRSATQSSSKLRA